MAMNDDILGNLIKTNLDTLTDEEKRDPVKVWVQVAKAIIDHIKSNAEIGSLIQSGIVAGGGISVPATIVQQGQTQPNQIGKIS